MRLLGKILAAPITGPPRALAFVIRGIYEQVASEYLDEGKAQAELLDLTLRYDQGELSDEQFTAQQERLLQHIEDIQNYKEEEAEELAASDEDEDEDEDEDDEDDEEGDEDDEGDDEDDEDVGDGARETVEE